MKLEIELDETQVEKIVVSHLKEHRRMITPYYRDVPLYSQDKKLNAQMTKEMKAAFTKVLEWYGVYK